MSFGGNAFAAELAALVQVVLIDITLAGDNAVVVGLAVAGLPAAQKSRAILIGIAAATLIRVALAVVAVRLLAVIGLTLAGGLLLLWVCWRMGRDLLHHGRHGTAPAHKTLRAAIFQITLADLSMSLDNVLAVAGAARSDRVALVVGLLVSVVLMGAAATAVANLVQRHRAIAFVGIAIVLAVALRMVWDGAHDVLARSGAAAWVRG